MRDSARQRDEPRGGLASVSWAARTAGVSRSVAYCWARAGQLPGAVNLGGRWYVKTAVLRRWLEGLEGDADPSRSDAPPVQR